MSRLIVKNLPKTITEEKIRKIFSEKGEITDVQLKYTSEGKFRQFCFIGYHTNDQAQDAINFFNKTCINTSKITVQECAQLGDSSKPQAWSKYAPDSTAFKKKHKKEPVVEKVEEKPKEKKNKIKELVEKYKDDPLFEEFMQLHGTSDIQSLLSKLEESEEKINKLQEGKDEDNNNDDNDKDEEDSGNESTDETEEKVANKKISDLEYMKLLMSNSVEKKPRQKMEKKPKEKIKLFTVKLRGLPYTCKKSDVKKFFYPLVPYTIRIPRSTKGFAYVGFKTEKKMKTALNKDRSFIGGKRIAVFEYLSKDEEPEVEETDTDARKSKWNTQEDALKHEEDIAESGRIFLRNLSYTTVEKDVEDLFSKFGPITEVNLPIDKNTRKPKGYGIVTFLMPEHAVQAYLKLDGSILQGRMLHLLPAKAKETPEVDNSDSFKSKQAQKTKAQAGSSHNWNTLFMGLNAVAETIAENYGTSKEHVLDGRGKGSAAVRLALGETQIVSQTKQFLENSGVSLDAFNNSTSTQRSKTVILVKNLPAQTNAGEIQRLFAPHGLIGRVVLPPSGVTAIVEFLEPSEARKAFTRLAYSKFKSGPLYLEWAPENSFVGAKTQNKINDKEDGKIEEHKPEEKKAEKEENSDNEEEEDDPEPDTTLFVKNLNFTTTEDVLRKHFEPIGKLNYVSVAMKNDPNNAGNKLSMGYGFVRFQYKAGANKALKDFQQSTLEGKTLELKRSERTLQSEVKTRKKSTKNTTKQTGSKILVRNVPFQANKGEIEQLFKAFGEIKALRLPKKMTSGPEQHRGFAFIDYVTKSDAKRAFKALSQSTHLYGRRLALEWAASEEGVEDIRKRTAKHFHAADDSTAGKHKKSTLDTDSFINN